jgi:hypothetical protein
MPSRSSSRPCPAALAEVSLACTCRWGDLPALDADTAAHAAKLRTQLTGDSAHQHSTEGASAAEDESGEGSKTAVREVQRLRFMIDSINAATAVLPKVSAYMCVLRAHKHTL